MTSFSLTSSSSRLLAEDKKVELVSGTNGRCKVRDSISHYDGETVATGIMFSVTAKQDVEILSFEFSNLPIDEEDQLEVEIYTRNRGDFMDFVDDPEGWTKFGETVGVPDPEGVGAIAPRGDMLQRAISMTSGETRSFYLTLKSQHLKVDNSEGNTGTVYVSDSLLDINVGVSLRKYPFDASPDENRAFSGRIHYRANQSCNNFGTNTEVIILWAAPLEATVVDVNPIFRQGLDNALIANPKLRVMVNSHGLSLNNAQSEALQEQDNCSEFGIDGGCVLYNGIANYRHFQSLSSETLIFEMTSNFAAMGTLSLDDKNFDLVYAGNEVLDRHYDITLKGAPDDVLLNPLQRSYIEDVTADFLASYSGVVPSSVDFVRQYLDDGRRRRHLRGQNDERRLQATGVTSVEASIKGIGASAKSFFRAIEDAFRNDGDNYRELMIKQQFRPSQINDGQNFGQIFGGLFAVSVSNTFSNETLPDDDDETEGGLSKPQIQIIVFSIILGLSFLYLAFRIYTDCFSSTGKATTKKLRRNQAKEEAAHKLSADERENLLNNMDLYPKLPAAPEQARPRGRGRSSSPSRGVAKSVSGGLGFFSNDPKDRGRSRSPTNTGRGRSISPSRGGGRGRSQSPSQQRGRSNSPSRGVGRGRSQSPSQQTRGRSRSPTRGVGQTASFKVPSKSSFHRSSFTIPSKSSQGNRSFTVPSKFSDHDRKLPSRPEPTRGVAKSNTFSGYDGFQSSGSPQRGVRSTNSGGLDRMVRGRPEPSSRGVGRSNTFGGETGFYGGSPQAIAKPKAPSWATKSNGAAPGAKKPKAKNAKPGSKKKKKTKDGTKSPKSPKASKSPKRDKDSPKVKGKKGKKKGGPKKNKSADSVGPGALVPYTPSDTGKPAKPPTRVDMIGPLA